MENKYFTPDIEDLCIGYECEYNFARAYKNEFDFVKIGYKDVTPGEAGYTDELTNMIHLIDDGAAAIRVPYLTKKQIKAEGWKLKNTHPEWPTFEKGNYWVTLITEEDKLPFIRIMGIDPMLIVGVKYLSSYNVYQGQCKSINELRKICKLLGI